jgi:ankyrin repeat protein
MRIPSSRSTRSSITESAKRVLLFVCYLAAWVMVPLLAIWPAGDPHPEATAMFLAAQSGNVPAMNKILRGGLDVDCCDEMGTTPLMIAARIGHLGAVRKLLAAGASIDACAPVYGTPLMAAVMNGHHDVMRELIERGANVDAVNPTGQTALWHARSCSDEEAVRILIAAGAVAEGHSTVPSEPEVVEQGADIQTPSEMRAITTARSAVPSSAARSERRNTFVRSAQ